MGLERLFADVIGKSLKFRENTTGVDLWSHERAVQLKPSGPNRSMYINPRARRREGGRGERF